MPVNIPSQIVVQTAAQWGADATVYSAKRLLITSDEYYGSTDQRKIKIANGVDTWTNLDYLPILGVTVSDTTRYTNTGNTNENVLTSLLITGGTLTNKIFEVYIRTITSTAANNKTFRIYFNSTPNLIGSPILAATYTASTAGGLFTRKFKDLGTTIKNYIATGTSFSNFESSTSSTSTENTLSVNLTSNMYVVITAQNVSSTENAIVDFCYLKNLT